MGEIYEKGLVKYEKVVKKNLQDANALIWLKPITAWVDGYKAILVVGNAQKICELKNDSENGAKFRKRLLEFCKNYPY